MKQILLAVVAGTAAFGASAADGTFAASNVIGGVRQYVYNPDGSKLSVSLGAVEFLYNGGVVGQGTYRFLKDGLFSAGTVAIPDQAGKTVDITIEVWDKTYGETYEIAATKPFALLLLPQTVTITLGGAGSPPATAASLTGFTGGTLYFANVPEPSGIALAALGLGGLFFVSRRK